MHKPKDERVLEMDPLGNLVVGFCNHKIDISTQILTYMYNRNQTWKNIKIGKLPQKIWSDNVIF